MKLLINSIVGLLILLASCKEDRHVPEAFAVNLDQEFSIEVNDIFWLKQDSSLSFSFIGVVEDSRCPITVQCIWEGQFTGQFKCSGCLDSLFELTLRADQEHANSYEDEWYKLTLVDVLPYPHTTGIIELEDYQLTMIISEL